jgi:hypothetical protein
VKMGALQMKYRAVKSSLRCLSGAGSANGKSTL